MHLLKRVPLRGQRMQGSTQGHWRFPAGGLEQGYAYLLTHPGTPCLFYDHLEDRSLAHTLQRLVALRLRAGIHCRSEVGTLHTAATGACHGEVFKGLVHATPTPAA